MTKVVILDGPQAGSTHELGRETTIGNASVNDIVVQGPKVADMQARLVQEQQRFFVENTTGGGIVSVNGKTVEGREDLADGDRIEVGDVGLLFNPPDASAPDKIRQLLQGSKRPSVGVILPLLTAAVFLETLWAIQKETAALIGGILAGLGLAGYLVKVAFDGRKAAR